MKKFILGLATLGILGAILIPSLAEAYQGDPSIKGPNFSEERHNAMTKAFEKNDYNSWKVLMNGRGRVSQVINEKNFPKFAEAHKLMLQGKTEEASKIKQELGLGLRNGMGQGAGCNRNR